MSFFFSLSLLIAGCVWKSVPGINLTIKNGIGFAYKSVAHIQCTHKHKWNNLLLIQIVDRKFKLIAIPPKKQLFSYGISLDFRSHILRKVFFRFVSAQFQIKINLFGLSLIHNVNCVAKWKNIWFFNGKHHTIKSKNTVSIEFVIPIWLFYIYMKVLKGFNQ